MSDRVRLKAWPRVHLGLIDLGGTTARRYGGAGCAVDGPVVEVVATPSDRLTLEGPADADTRTEEDLSRLEAGLASVLGGRGARVEVTATPPQHVGLGSKTALLLGTATAALEAAGLTIGRHELQLLSGRGGTSGAGINLFFEGGFIVDGGQPPSPVAGFGPSSSSTPAAVPPVLARHPIPEDWRFQLMWDSSAGLSGAAERALFESATPLPETEVHRALAAVHHSILPGFALGELDLVARGLATMHEVGFKRCELAAQPERLQRLYRELAALPGTAVGLSSVGPLLFAITASEQSRALVAAAAASGEMPILACAKPINHGYSLKKE